MVWLPCLGYLFYLDSYVDSMSFLVHHFRAYVEERLYTTTNLEFWQLIFNFYLAFDYLFDWLNVVIKSLELKEAGEFD